MKPPDAPTPPRPTSAFADVYAARLAGALDSDAYGARNATEEFHAPHAARRPSAHSVPTLTPVKRSRRSP